MDEITKAYIAGLYDGEGWSGVRKYHLWRENKHVIDERPGVTLAMADEKIMLWVYEKFGGRGYWGSYQSKKSNTKLIYRIQIASKKDIDWFFENFGVYLKRLKKYELKRYDV